MSSKDDEEPSSDMNTSEMEEKLPEIEEMKRESLVELSESNVNVVVERNETVSLEDKVEPSDGGGGEKAEYTTEVAETPAVAVAVAVAGDEQLDPKGSELLVVESLVGEGVEPVFTTENPGVVAEQVVVTVVDDEQLDSKGSELLVVDSVAGEKLEEGVAPVAEQVGDDTGNGSGENMQIEASGEKLLVEPVIGTNVKEETVSVVDSSVEAVVVTEIGGTGVLPQLQMDGTGDELMAEFDKVGTVSDVGEPEMGDGDNVEEVAVGVKESVESREIGNGSDAVGVTDADGVEKVDTVIHDSEVGNTEKPAGMEEKNGNPMTSIEVSIPEGEFKVEAVTEVKTGVVNASEGEKVLELMDGADSAHLAHEHTDDKTVSAEENMSSETKSVDENLSVEVLKKPNSDELVHEPENREEEAITEEVRPAGDVKEESEGRVELESAKRDVPEEIQLVDTPTGADTEPNMVADKIPDTAVKMETDETRSDLEEPGEELDDSPSAVQDEEDEAMDAEEETGAQDTEMETETDVPDSGKASGGKRKRGKFSKSPSTSKATGKAASKKLVGEDVCFICFDGGDLVLCDRRGCPKAYHPSCVDRDEAFFKAKGRWNCGWHLCTMCQKNARYMCWTCTYSLCRSCTKENVILCVRGNKGFCDTCMKTVKLIENNDQGDKDSQIDFDDRSSWEFLFKDYYTELKAKLSLTSVEIAEAKNPFKGADVSGSSKKESSEAQADGNDEGSNSDRSTEKLETVRPKRRKLRKQSNSLPGEEELVGAAVVAGRESTTVPDNSEWASKELLEFIAHMKDGDTSVLSQFDVQALLLEYIKSNKLRDPRRKSQIRCDARLENLFGKARVGHFEMLKLLESHFFSRDEQNDDVQGSVVDTEHNQLDIDDSADTKGRKRKTRRKSGSRMPQSNLDDYAAIDMHNITLIYLRRKLMEDLLEDTDTFHDKVVGTFVRIRISVSTQKQDLYRLVQVVGTSKTAEPYKVGKKTTDIMVEILNLDKTEVIPIDTISNQEFTEEECKRLRQSIKCGLISRLTVGEILDKTTEIQVARVNDWLESETLRLSHLRDRASDMGRRKELRECVEKLQLLKTPEERRRRLEELPDIHADPKMDPNYESEENESDTDNRRDAYMRSKIPGFSRRGRAPISPRDDNSAKDTWGGAANLPSKNWESNRNPSSNNFSSGSTHYGELGNESSWNIDDKDNIQESRSVEKLNSVTNSESLERVARPVTPSESFTAVTSVTPQASHSTGVAEASVKINESEKIWHYKDPSGKVQGPFSVIQLRKWNNNGYFPSDLRIWRTTETQDNSILLADVLAGKLPKSSQVADDTLPETSTLHDLRTLVGHSVKTPEKPLFQDRERSNTDQNSAAISTLSASKWDRNDLPSLPSPTPRQNNAGLIGVDGTLLAAVMQSPGVNVVHPSPSAVLPNIATQATAYSPTPSSQQGILVGTPDSRHHQPIMTNDPHAMQMPNHAPTFVQAVPAVTNQSLQADTQAMGGVAQSGQPQAYGWVAPSVQGAGTFSNPATAALPQGSQPNLGWGQPNTQPPPAPNAAWGMAPAENTTQNMGWGPAQVPANQNMGWGNPAPGNTTMNWGPPPMQTPSPANAAVGWGPPTGANMQVAPVQGNMTPGWGPGQVWGGPPVQAQMPSNGWGPPPGGNSVPPAPVQGPAQGNQNQGWGAPPGNQGQWVGDQNFGGGGGNRGRDTGFGGGGRPWNRQGGGNRPKRDTICPFNANGRCRKGSRCDYRHA